MPTQGSASNGTADVDILDRLFDAVRDAEPSTVREILNYQPSLVNSFNKFRPETPQCLFERRRFEYVLAQDILSREDDKVIVTEFCRQRPLHLACIIGDVETVKAVLEQKDHIRLHEENDNGETSFSLACRSANLCTAELLLDNGFKLSPTMVDNGTLDYLVYRGVYPEWSENPPEDQFDVFHRVIEKVMDEFLDKASKGQLLRSVAEEGNLPMLEAVLKAWLPEPDLNAADEYGWTPLHSAAAGGHLEVVERLLEKGTDPNARTKPPNQVDAGELAVDFLNGSETAEDILLRIKAAQSNGDSIQNAAEHNERPCWQWVSHDRHRSGKKQRKVEESTVEQLIERYGEKGISQAQGETLWCHLEINSEQWIKDLCRNLFSQDLVKGREYLGHVRNVFDFAIQLPLNQHKLSEALFRQINERDDIALVIPIIDIDILKPGFADTRPRYFWRTPNRLAPNKTLDIDENHIQRMKKVHDQLKNDVHSSRTLDAYADIDLSDEWLDRYNVDQVLSRWFDKHHEQKDRTLPHRFGASQSSRLRKWFLTATRGLPWTGGKSADVEWQEVEALVQEATSNKLILVVSQLWMFKFGDVLITSYPERWDSSSKKSQFFELLRKMVEKRPRERFGSKLLFHKILEESMKFQANISSNLLSSYNVSSVGQSSVGAPRHKQVDAASYLEIFGKEVMRIWREVDKIYQEFKPGQGKTDENFAEYTERATECLISLDDVLDEIGTIKGVLEYQFSVWNGLHAADANEVHTKVLPTDTKTASVDARKLRQIPSRDKCGCDHDFDRVPDLETCTGDSKKLRRTPLKGECSWDPECNPTRSRESFFKHGVFSHVEKVEKDAKMLREKVKTLTELLYWQAGTESAIKSYELSRNLTVFTWLTVVFAPLSFVTALFSLQIESFPQGSWAGWQVATGSGMCLVLRPYPLHLSSQCTDASHTSAQL
ncbi:hypothetical protein FJTKL_02101 [Diaporthe vaccinii]|uniref:Ankyrin repeat protein n=1 Tax=Diaporthe vaccinii TaxID=105482 RepID=A0ABR4DYU2_9PEZI